MRFKLQAADVLVVCLAGALAALALSSWALAGVVAVTAAAVVLSAEGGR